MSSLRPLRALVWKELRASRLFVLVLAAIPPVLLEAAAAFPERSWPRNTFQYGCSLIFAMLIAVWGSTKPTAEKNTSEFADTYLPVKPYVRWLASFVVPLAIVAALGAWYTVWLGALSSRPSETVYAEAGMLIMSLVFCVSYILSAAISRWLGLLAGTISATVAGVLLLDTYDMELLDRGLWLIQLASVVVGIVVFDLLLRSRPLRLRQVVALLIPIATCAVMYISLPKDNEGRWLECQMRRIDSSDWAMYTRPLAGKGSSPSVKLEFGNYRTDTRAVHRFRNAIVALDFLGEDRVYLAQQLPHESGTWVLEWNTKSNQVRKVARLATGRRAWDWFVFSGPRGFVRPDGKYMVVSARSAAGDGQDIWVVYLDSGVGVIAAPNVGLREPFIRWVGDSALLYGPGKPIRIDLRAATARLWTASAKGVR